MTAPVRGRGAGETTGGSTRTVTVVYDRARGARAVRVPFIRLSVLKGPDRKRERTAKEGVLRVGTGEGADLRLTDSTVSALHCEVRVDATGVRVRDLGSKNGVRLGSHRVVEAYVVDGDRLSLGETVLKVHLPGDVELTPLPLRTSFGRLLGSSAAMRQAYLLLERAARSEAPLLIQGETGTGKELAAEALVAEGPRPDGPLVVVDCGRLPPNLAESELFGHEPGAFTGAHKRHIGAFERAHGGTLFLDEVGELPLEVQPRLLGVLERRSFQRVGGQERISVDIRVVSATHRELEPAVNRGSFRPDLYYRLSAITVRLPPLRDRPEDIPLLVAHFLEELGAAEPLPLDVLERLFAGEYPGNVRELRNAVERALAGVDVAPPPRQAGAEVDPAVPYRVQKERLVDAFEHAYFERMLAECGGNLSELARRSGLSRFHVHEVVRRLGLRRSAGGPR